MNNGRSLTRSEHRRHDRLLVTRFAMGDAYPSERDEASVLVEKCAECAELAADVKLIASSMSRLPVAPRTRDFMITAEQADKLRGGRVSRWLRSLGTPGWAMLRPVAGVALSIGLVMAVVGAGMPGTLPVAEFRSDTPGQGAASPDSRAAESMEPLTGVPDQQPAGEGPPGVESDQETHDPASEQLDTAYVAASPDANEESERTQLAQTVPADPTRNLLVYAGLIIAMLSFALLALSWVARRYFADPLLR